MADDIELNDADKLAWPLRLLKSLRVIKFADWGSEHKYKSAMGILACLVILVICLNYSVISITTFVVIILTLFVLLVFLYMLNKPNFLSKTHQNWLASVVVALLTAIAFLLICYATIPLLEKIGLISAEAPKPPPQPSTITFVEFAQRLNAIREKSDHDSEEAEFVKQYEGKQIEWEGIVNEIKRTTKSYYIIPSNELTSPNAQVTLDDADFDPSLPAGSKIKIRGTIYEINEFGVVLPDSERFDK